MMTRDELVVALAGRYVLGSRADRLHSPKSDKMVSWAVLKIQFGIVTAQMFNFRSKFTSTLGLATAVYPAVRVDITDRGVVIKPSRPPVAPKGIAGRVTSVG